MKLEVTNVEKRFGDFTALSGLNFATHADARVVALLGPSGGGKSTLLRLLGSLLLPDSGELRLDGQPLSQDTRKSLQQLRGNGFVFQGFNLFPHLTAMENILLPLRVVHGLYPAAAEKRAKELLERLGLADHCHKRPSQLSGGQQQRAAIARALAPKPKLLLLDEPTSALDPVMTGEVLDVIRELAVEGQQIVLATHEVSFARQIADWIVFLAAGRAEESRPAADFFHQPESILAATYLESLSKYR